tara:strand:- start:110 stop:661 length:552 start_codon:yes stop_codon:yes gene_type:complete
MPYDSSGNWIAPAGFEDYDQQSLFQQTQSGGMSTIITDMLQGYDYWDEFMTAYEAGDQTLTNPITGELYEGGVEGIGDFIAGYVTPFDATTIDNIRSDAATDKIRAREEMYAGSMQASKMAAKSGFSSGYASSTRKANLWDEYLNTHRLIDSKKSSRIYEAKGDWLDDMFMEIAETWSMMYGE